MSTNPIALAVAPLADAAEKDATEAMQARVVAALQELAAADWNLPAVAPRANSRTMGRREYLAAQARESFFDSITQDDRGRNGYQNRWGGKTYYVTPREAGIKYVVEGAAKAARASYDAYVAKLISKVGEGVVAAELEGGWLWGRSVLSVTFEDGRSERWETKQILNVSVLGKLFNQWPTRKLGVRA